MDRLKFLSKRDFFRSKPKQRQQGVRGVYKDVSSSIASATTATPAPQPNPVYFNYQADPASGKNVVPWGDVLLAFPEAKYIRHGSTIIPFVRDKDFKIPQCYSGCCSRAGFSYTKR